MTQFIRVCNSVYGGRSGIYYDINPELVVELHIERTQHEINVEAALVNGHKVIILKLDDLELLVGEERAKEIVEKMQEKKEELERYKGI